MLQSCCLDTGCRAEGSQEFLQGQGRDFSPRLAMKTGISPYFVLVQPSEIGLGARPCRGLTIYSAGQLVRTNFGKFPKKIGTRANRT